MTVLIRPIRSSEADRFLEVLCDVFELDFLRARGVFFQEPSFDLSRKWALFVDGEMVSILTTASLLLGDFRAFGIAGVATLRAHRGKGYGERLIQEVCATAAAQGETRSLLFAKQTGLYERCGFTVIDEVIQGKITALATDEEPDQLEFREVVNRYEAWSSAHPMRLRRDSLRWDLWKYNLRVCEAVGAGYVCYEGSIVREAVLAGFLDAWPTPPGAEWFGLRSLTESLQVPGDFRSADLLLMGRGWSAPPQMFMTDQF